VRWDRVGSSKWGVWKDGGSGETDTEEGWSWKQESLDSDVCILEAREREFRCASRDIIENHLIIDSRKMSMSKNNDIHICTRGEDHPKTD
jgi:hypothetical protein